jgi:hypothetical protein
MIGLGSTHKTVLATGFCRSSFRRNCGSIITIAGPSAAPRKIVPNATRHKTISNSSKNGSKDPTVAFSFYIHEDMYLSIRAKGHYRFRRDLEVSVESYVTREGLKYSIFSPYVVVDGR